MQISNREILVVGDRLLVQPDNPEERTKVGLYLPQRVLEREAVQAGRVLATGPGYAVPNLAHEDREPWQEPRLARPHYIPLQAEVGDYVLFLRKDAVEVRYQSTTFLVVPQSAVLLLIRGEDGTPSA